MVEIRVSVNLYCVGLHEGFEEHPTYKSEHFPSAPLRSQRKTQSGKILQNTASFLLRAEAVVQH